MSGMGIHVFLDKFVCTKYIFNIGVHICEDQDVCSMLIQLEKMAPILNLI